MLKETLFLKQLVDESIDPDYFSTVLSYATTKIESLQYNQKDNTIAVSFNGEKKELDEIVKKVTLKIGKEVINKKNRLIFSHASKKDPVYTKKSSFKKLQELGIIYDFGNGHISYQGLFLELLQNIDDTFSKIAKHRGAVEIHLPSFVQWENIKKLGFIDEYPHYLFFTAPLIRELEVVEKFQNLGKKESPELKRYLSNPHYCLKPSACSLLYPIFEGYDFEKNSLYTTLGSCTRHETLNVTSCERLTEFQMREIVYVGDKKGQEDFFCFSMDLIKDMIRLFDLTAQIRTANDSFFVSNYSKFRLMQLLGYSKYEATVLIPDADTHIAFASYNNHQNFFSNRFHFTINKDSAVTSCIGFGLERLVYAAICHHGLERERLFGMINSLREKYRIEQVR